nr:hypothetical protein [Tanacetum cinerariifolium]
MSTNEQTPLSQPTSAVRNTLGREQAPQNLARSKLIFRASLLPTRSTFVVLSVGMPISAGMTAFVLYVNENGVSPLLDFIIVRESEPADNVVPHKFFDLISIDGRDRFCFNPFCKVVRGHY